MNRASLIRLIERKKSSLCVGLDTDLKKIPEHLLKEENPALAFNKAIIDATRDFAVAYKINTAFYEAQGIEGWKTMQETLDYLGTEVFTIADAKRGDIGNTSEQYARTFFETYPFDSVTVAPYMGSDSVQPFLKFDGKWAIVLGLTSNAGSADFQMTKTENGLLYEKVLTTVAGWGTPSNTMFVIGATREDQLRHVRNLLPDHFFLIPGVGAQGGDVATVCEHAMNKDAGILINVSRGIIYAGTGASFQEEVHDAARKYQQQMEHYL